MSLQHQVAKLLHSAILETRGRPFEVSVVPDVDCAKVAQLLELAIKEKISGGESSVIVSVSEIKVAEAKVSLDPLLLKKAEEAFKADPVSKRDTLDLYRIDASSLKKPSFFGWLFLAAGFSAYGLVWFGYSWFLAGLASSVIFAVSLLVSREGTNYVLSLICSLVSLVISLFGLFFKS